MSLAILCKSHGSNAEVSGYSTVAFVYNFLFVFLCFFIYLNKKTSCFFKFIRMLREVDMSRTGSFQMLVVGSE